MLGVCGVAASVQTIYSFTFLSMVSPVTHSVASVTKRLSIIAVSALVFQTHLTGLNWLGIAISTMGVALYNKAKLEERARHAETLPVSERHKQDYQAAHLVGRGRGKVGSGNVADNPALPPFRCHCEGRGCAQSPGVVTACLWLAAANGCACLQ